MKTGIELIAQERQKQIEKHGWSLAHDKEHSHGELLKVAAILAVQGTDAKVVSPDGWETGSNIWGLEEKLKGDKIHRLKVVGALVAAEIDAEIDKLQNSVEVAGIKLRT
jgi:hypothetical protein